MVTDVFSKFTQAFATSDQRARTVAKILVEKWFCVCVVYILTKAVALRVSSFNTSVTFMEFRRVVAPHTTLRGMGSVTVLIECCRIC